MLNVECSTCNRLRYGASLRARRSAEHCSARARGRSADLRIGPVIHLTPPSQTPKLPNSPPLQPEPETRNLPPQIAEDRTCVRPSLTMRFIRRRPGAQKGSATNLGVAVQAALQAKPLCQP